MKLLTSNTLVKTTLTLALTSVLATTVYAKESAPVAATSDEVQQLRAEVNALKALLEQQLPKVQAQQQQQAAAVQQLQQQAEKKSPLTITTRGGAEAKIYGFIRGDAGYEFKGSNSQFANVAGATLGSPSTNQLNTTVATTRVGLEFKTPVEDANVGGKIEGDFSGSGYNGNGFRIRHAYLTYNNWLAGQTWSNFSDLNAFPDIIDFDLVPGQNATRTMQVRYSDNLTDKTKYIVSLEKNYHYERTPSLVGRIEHNFLDDKAYVSVRGLVAEAKASKDATAEITYVLDRVTNEVKPVERITGTAATDKDLAWGIAVAGQYKFTDNFSLAADYHHVKGDRKHVTGANPAYIFDGNDIVLNEFDAISLSGMYKFNPKLRTSFGYGYLQHKDGEYARVNPSANETLHQGWANVIYNPVQPISVGIEYLHGERETFNGQTGTDSRVGLMAQYDF